MPIFIGIISAWGVVLLTQFLLYKRERTRFLEVKLEELYLLVKKILEEQHLPSPPDNPDPRLGVDELKTYARLVSEANMRTLRDLGHISMLLHLYFEPAFQHFQKYESTVLTAIREAREISRNILSKGQIESPERFVTACEHSGNAATGFIDYLVTEKSRLTERLLS